MINRTLTLLLAVLLLLPACSNHPDKRPQPKEFFSTQISSEGSKFFVYRLELPARGKGDDHRRPAHGGRGGDSARAGAGSGKKSADMTVKPEQRLKALLADNNYCREGYVELERRQYSSGISLRGECREAATKQDRRRFGANDRP